MNTTRLITGLFGLALLGGGSGCIVLKPQHDELVKEVDELKKKVEQRDQELQAALATAKEQSAELERLTRSTNATLGVRVEDIESDIAENRGKTEDAANNLAALEGNLAEMRTDLDARLAELEGRLNQATDIPEGKQDLLKEADRQLKAKNYKQARNLYRTYLSRYPGDAKEPQVRFNIGQSLYSERDFRSALGEFYWIVQNAAESEVIHDALYYSGLAFAKLGQCEKAIAYFNALAASDSGAPDRYKTRAKEQITALENDDGTICTNRSIEGAKTKAPARANAKKSGS